MSTPISNKKSRWYKKQVLDRSDKELKISLEAQGHVFKSRISQAISAAMRCARVAVIPLDTVNANGLTHRVSANRETLYGLGFLDLGNSFLKLGHSTWRLHGSDGDVTVERLEDESVEAATFPKRKASKFQVGPSRMTQDLSSLGYPLAIQATMHLTEKVCARTANTKYVLPTEVLVRGIPARVAGYNDTSFLVEFQDSGITCFQPIAKLFDQDVNSRLFALQESAQALIASGNFSKAARARIAGEVEGDETLTKDDVATFIAAMDEAVEGALSTRLSRTGQSVQTWTDFNGSSVNDFGPTLHGCIAGDATKSFDWQLFEAGKIRDAGQAASMEEAQEDCATAASMVNPGFMAKAAQSDGWKWKTRA